MNILSNLRSMQKLNSPPKLDNFNQMVRENLPPFHSQHFCHKMELSIGKLVPTHQQNGLTKRKLRHILESGLTILAHSGLSNRYQVDAFLTFVYIINCLPTHVLTHSSPYEIFFNKAHNYSLLCVLGCICFLLLQPYTAHKLNYRPNACIFLGYSHAEYRCLDPLKDRVYLS